MNDAQQILDDSVARLFADQLDREALIRIEAQGWDESLWTMIEEQGLTQVIVSETHGGMGGGWIDAFIVARACGRYAVPLPVPETLLAGWLLSQAQLPPRAGAAGLIIAPLTSAEYAAGSVSLTAARVPWGRQAAYCVGITHEGELLVIDTHGVTCKQEDNLAREPRDEMTFNKAAILARGRLDLPADAMRALAALLRSAQIAGAAAACLELSVKYTSEREQFGRTLSQFQAIQHHLAELASQMASVDSMAMAACIALDERGLLGSGRTATFDLAAAKCRASDAVEAITRISHQVHGAIGFTYEYNLHFLTRRLWAWRAEFGANGEWGEALGQLAAAQGGANLWRYVTA